jgi:ribonuclease HI
MESEKKYKSEYEIVIFFDGSCFPNPGGPIGCGVIFYEAVDFSVTKPNTRDIRSSYTKMKIIDEITYRLPKNKKHTNSVSEHMALNLAFTWMEKNLIFNKKITIFGDNEMVIKQMKKEYKITSGKPYSEYAYTNAKLLSKLSSENEIEFIWIPREYNKEADRLSKESLESLLQ